MALNKLRLFLPLQSIGGKTAELLAGKGHMEAFLHLSFPGPMEYQFGLGSGGDSS